MAKRASGCANGFQRDFLEYNLKGTKVKGKVVSSVSNKYIYTECGDKIPKKMLQVTFNVKEESINMLRPDTSGDTEGDQL